MGPGTRQCGARGGHTRRGQGRHNPIEQLGLATPASDATGVAYMTGLTGYVGRKYVTVSILSSGRPLEEYVPAAAATALTYANVYPSYARVSIYYYHHHHHQGEKKKARPTDRLTAAGSGSARDQFATRKTPDA